MLKLALIVSCFILLAQSAPTESKKCDKPAAAKMLSCAPLINEMKVYTTAHKKDAGPETVEKTSEICSRIEECIAPVHCQEADAFKAVYAKICSLVYYATEDNKKCLSGFFKDAYLAQHSNESSCYKGFMEGTTHQKDAYINGNTCFLEHAKKSCSKPAQDFFAKNYEKFAELVTTVPEPNYCGSASHQMHTLSCNTISAESAKLSLEIFTSKKQFDSRLPLVRKICQDVHNCSQDTCKALSAKKTFACDMLELASGDWGACLNKIGDEKPDLSKYTCLGETNFFEMSEADSCEKFVAKKECSMKIMRDICGAKAVEKFDSISEIINKQFSCEK